MSYQIIYIHVIAYVNHIKLLSICLCLGGYLPYHDNVTVASSVFARKASWGARARDESSHNPLFCFIIQVLVNGKWIEGAVVGLFSHEKWSQYS